MTSLAAFLIFFLDLYTWALIIYAIMGWLVIFGVIDQKNRFLAQAYFFLQRLIEPALAPLRRIIPSIGGLDLSFLALYFLLFLFKTLLIQA